MLAIDLATDPVVRAFFHDLVKEGVSKDAEDFIVHKPEFAIPIPLACALFRGNTVNLRYTQMEERDVVRDAYFIAAIWLLLGTEIRNMPCSDEQQIALINSVYVGAGKPRELVLDVRQVEPAIKRVPLAHTNFLGIACGFEPVATVEEFTSAYATLLISLRPEPT